MTQTSQPALIPEFAVTDWQASRDFYVDVLGFAVAYDRPDEGFVMLTMGAAHLMIDQIGLGRDFESGFEAETRPFGRGLNVQIRVDALDPILARLEAAGWPLFLPREERWYRAGTEALGHLQAVVADPDGYLLRFFQDLGRRPAT